jgi:polyisoprenyl-teichoic acid--peptidoglycan teichoic acid transferase
MRNFDGINNQTSSDNSYSPSPFVQLQQKKPKRRRFWRWFLVFVVILGGVGVFWGSQILSKTNQIFTNKQNIFKRFGQLIVSDDKPLKGEETGKVNILLLGIGGPGHEGPNLTDTMIVASINVQTKEVLFTSLPRDFLVQLPKRGFNKINAAYAYAEVDEKGSGGPVAISMAEKVTGLTIPYFAVVDFKGFVKAVDRVGGLDITIDKTFTDSQYPNYNYGYLAPQTFTKGQEHMNGERALIFARSRHGNNGEGSDFARSERQKKIMVGMRDELTQLNLTDLGTLNGLLSDFTENFRTNMEPYELIRLASLGKEISGDNAYSVSLDPDNKLICDGLIDLNTGRPSAPLPEPTLDEEGNEIPAAQPEPNSRIYVIQPCEGVTLADISSHLNAVMDTAQLQKEKAVIEIINTTGKSYVTERWRDLADSATGMTIKFSASKTPVDRSIFYDNSNGSKPKTLDYIKSNYTLDKSDLPYTQSTADFVIILGQDAL